MKRQVIRLTAVVGAAVLAASIAQAQYTENFDSYSSGSSINGQGGWAQWNATAVTDGVVSTSFSHSGANSLQTELHADKVQTQSFTTGHWNWSVWTYVPSTTTLPQWAIFLTTYNVGGPFFWNAQIKLDPSLADVYADLGPNAVCGGTPVGQSFGNAVHGALVTNTWVEVRLDIDLNADRCQAWYNNIPLGQVYQWTDGIDAGFSANQIGTIDLYANDNTLAGDRVYWDDVTITANANPTPECLGVGTVYCTPGTSQSGCVPVISSTGVASASASSGFTIDLTAGEGNKQGLLFYGITGQLLSGAPWGPGSSSTLCVKAPTQRTPLQPASGTVGNCDGNFSIDWNTYMFNNPLSVGNPRSIGETFDAQYWYRDNSAAVKTTSLSAGLHFALKP